MRPLVKLLLTTAVALACEGIGLLIIHATRDGPHRLATPATYVLTGLVGVVVLAAAVWLIPEDAARSWALANKKDRIELRDKTRGTLVGLIGGLGLVATFAVTLYQVNQARRASDATLRLTNEGQLQDRFSRAIDHIGALDSKGRKILEVRLGGIYALGRFGRASDAAREDASAILSAYVRDNSPLRGAKAAVKVPAFPSCRPQSHLGTDVAAALKELQNLYPAFEGGRDPELDLSNTDLSDADLRNFDLRNADLTGSRLVNADLDSADLANATLTAVDGRAACFALSRLAGANFSSAGNAHAAQLRRDAADLRLADFDRVDLNKVEMPYVDLRKARIVAANVDRGDFSGSKATGLVWNAVKGRPLLCPPGIAPCTERGP
jgi:hypothetical protein